MTKQEATQILAILKAAYPNSYKNMTKEEAVGTVNVWATQFSNIPANIVNIAITKLISTNTFPPSIGEVKEKIRGLYWEAWHMLNDRAAALNLDESTKATLRDIIRVCEPMRTREKLEPTLADLLTGFTDFLADPQRASMKRLS